MPCAVTRSSNPAASTVAPTSSRPSSRGTRYAPATHVARRTKSGGTPSASICPLTGTTGGTHGARHAASSCAAQAPQALIAARGRNEAQLGAHAEHAARVALDAADAARRRMLTPRAVAGARRARGRAGGCRPSLRRAREAPPVRAAPSHGSAAISAERVEHSLAMPRDFSRASSLAQSCKPRARRSRRGARRRRAQHAGRRRRRRARARRTARILAQRCAHSSSSAGSRRTLRVRRQHAGTGPRRGARGFAAIVDANGRAALGEFEGDREADQARTDDDDVAARSLHRLHSRVDGTFAALRRHPGDDLVRIGDVAGLAMHAVGEVDLQAPFEPFRRSSRTAARRRRPGRSTGTDCRTRRCSDRGRCSCRRRADGRADSLRASCRCCRRR